MLINKEIRIWLVILISLILLSQSVIGCRISEDVDKNIINVVNSKYPYDLQIHLHRIEFERYEKEEDKYYSIYIVNYTIKNIADVSFEPEGSTLITVGWAGTFGVVAYWEENITILGPGESISYEKEVEILSSTDPNEDKERYFADHEVGLFIPYGPAWTEPPVFYNTLRAKYYNNKLNYTPTLAHLLVSTPWRYNITSEGVNYSEAYYLELKDIDELPGVIKDRLGYVKELSMYISKINEKIKSIVQNYDKNFIYNIWDLLEPLLFSIKNICKFYENLINGTKSSDIEMLLKNLTSILDENIILLSNESETYYGFIISEIEDLTDLKSHLSNFVYDDKPWEKTIRVKGKLEGLRAFELIKISCRNENRFYLDRNDGYRDRKVCFDFYANSKPTADEDTYFEVHNCTLKVKGLSLLRRKRFIESVDLFSYCYSNGSIIITFEGQSWGWKRIINDRLQELVRNTFLHDEEWFFFSKNKQIKKNDLSSLYLEENGWIHMEYYPGAHSIPGVTYYAPDQLIVCFKPSVDVLSIDNVSGYPVVDVNKELNAVVIEAVDENLRLLIQGLEDNEEIEYAELNLMADLCDINPTDPYWDKQWGHRAIKLPQAWEFSRGKGVRVAVLDTGIDTKCSPININYSRVVQKANFVEEQYFLDPFDTVGHGTACTGLIMGGLNDDGIAGVAPECEIIAIRVMGGQKNSKSGTLFDIAEGIKYASHYADVMCLAFAFYSLHPGTETLHRVIENASKKGIIIVAAAGNGPYEFIAEPAAWSETIAVGAIDENLNRCKFSNYGNELDIVAPGENIYAPDLFDEYRYVSGTSMAAAYVAGVAALYLERYPNTSPKEFKEKLRATAKDLGSRGWDIYYGCGLVDAMRLIIDLTVDFTWMPTRIYVGTEVVFKSTSKSLDGIAKYVWIFDDNVLDSFNPVVTYTYWRAGTHTVELWVLTNCGVAGECKKQVTVQRKSRATELIR